MNSFNPTTPSLIQPVVPTSVPFTYRDGLTMLQLIECIKHNLETLQTYVNGVVDNVNKALNDQTTQNQDTLDKAQQAAQDAADAIKQAQDALTQYQQIVTNVNTALTTANAAIDRLEALGVTDPEAAAELKKTIEQTATNLTALEQRVTNNENNVTAIDANLNALHANSVIDATRLYNSISSLRRMAPQKIGWIGDSWSDPETAAIDWVSVVANNLGAQVVNEAISGSGFLGNVSVANNFAYQLQQLKNNNPDIDVLVIFGGENDMTRWGSQETQIRQNIVSFVTQLNEQFPGIPVHLFLSTIMNNVTAQTAFNYYTRLLIEFSKANNLIVHKVDYILFSAQQWKNPDGNDWHPNENVDKYLVEAFTSMLRGGDFIKLERTWQCKPESSSVESTANGVIELGRNKVTFNQFSLTPTNTIIANATLTWNFPTPLKGAPNIENTFTVYNDGCYAEYSATGVKVTWTERVESGSTKSWTFPALTLSFE